LDCVLCWQNKKGGHGGGIRVKLRPGGGGSLLIAVDRLKRLGPCLDRRKSRKGGLEGKGKPRVTLTTEGIVDSIRVRIKQGRKNGGGSLECEKRVATAVKKVTSAESTKREACEEGRDMRKGLR